MPKRSFACIPGEFDTTGLPGNALSGCYWVTGSNGSGMWVNNTRGTSINGGLAGDTSGDKVGAWIPSPDPDAFNMIVIADDTFAIPSSDGSTQHVSIWGTDAQETSGANTTVMLELVNYLASEGWNSLSPGYLDWNAAAADLAQAGFYYQMSDGRETNLAG